MLEYMRKKIIKEMFYVKWIKNKTLRCIYAIEWAYSNLKYSNFSSLRNYINPIQVWRYATMKKIYIHIIISKYGVWRWDCWKNTTVKTILRAASRRWLVNIAAKGFSDIKRHPIYPASWAPVPGQQSGVWENSF